MLEKLSARYADAHVLAVESWDDGDILSVWLDENGNVCIKYESGKWWHYREAGDGTIEWW